ncbi:acyl carrier protein [Bacteriovorax sp. Seq25_V]|uniref:acyl carrier protein n=1 Tax=Bacteriovorax sp. Seq25_V TaxID=1201288 RepID=UPI000389EBCD|nr:phosphopantetheine-binding protein [Bacteriovorax sp. Seq25_V]EQC47718.1 putative acyl carrier protein [Bacteriovorax sp. Seq25_V]
MKPDRSDILDLIYDITGIEQEDIKDSDEFKTDLKMDSISIADLISSLEEDFDVIIEQEQALNIKTVAQLMEFISNYE